MVLQYCSLDWQNLLMEMKILLTIDPYRQPGLVTFPLVSYCMYLSIIGRSFTISLNTTTLALSLKPTGYLDIPICLQNEYTSTEIVDFLFAAS